MPLRDLARYLRDDVLARERLRRANPGALVASRVIFAGDVSRTTLEDGVSVYGPTVLVCADGGGLTGSRLHIGAGTFVGEFNNLRTAGAPILIGRNCLVSQHITMVGSNHGTRRGTPVAEQDWTGDGIVIGDDVWIGAGVTVLPGARVGDGAVLAANSVVRGEVPANAIYAGSPARQVGERTD